MVNQPAQKQQPPKELARKWLAREISQHRPPPDINQIRRELGWGLNDPAKNGRFP